MKPKVGWIVGFENRGEVFADDALRALAAAEPFGFSAAGVAGEVRVYVTAVPTDLFPRGGTTREHSFFSAVRANAVGVDCEAEASTADSSIGPANTDLRDQILATVAEERSGAARAAASPRFSHRLPTW